MCVDCGRRLLYYLLSNVIDGSVKRWGCSQLCRHNKLIMMHHQLRIILLNFLKFIYPLLRECQHINTEIDHPPNIHYFSFLVVFVCSYLYLQFEKAQYNENWSSLRRLALSSYHTLCRQNKHIDATDITIQTFTYSNLVYMSMRTQ